MLAIVIVLVFWSCVITVAVRSARPKGLAPVATSSDEPPTYELWSKTDERQLTRLLRHAASGK